MRTKTDVSKYIVNVQGKDFITFPGLLQEAHALGLKSINTELLTPSSDLSNPVVKATVSLLYDNVERVFTGYGDASEKNVAPKVKGALLRMAETRATARALRFACNIDMAALEELDAEENVISSKKTSSNTEEPKSFQKSTQPSLKSFSSNTLQQVKPVTTQNKPTQQTFQSRTATASVKPQLVHKAASVAEQTSVGIQQKASGQEDVEF